jgi:anaerobic selenocysteine-containing dehydrogenase
MSSEHATVQRKTTCNRDCPDACSIVATVQDGRITHLGGDPEHPITQGFLCYRTSHFLNQQYAPDRITTPLLRNPQTGQLEPVSWDRALSFAAEALLRIRAESGPAAIFHYRSGGTLGMVPKIVDLFFERFGPVTVKRGDICSGAGDYAQETDFGVEDSSDVFDLYNAKSILLWGKNIWASSPHLIPILREAKRRGARLTLIDPVWHRTATLCERTIAVRPGGDFALAMAVALRLHEQGKWTPRAAEFCDHLPAFTALCQRQSVQGWAAQADVTLAEVDHIAQALSAGSPATILVGWGMGRRKNGVAIVRALDALGAVSGNLGIPGGGVSFYFKRRAAFDTSFCQGTSARTVCEPLFGRDILAAQDPPIRAVWITAGNPVAMLPESGTTVQALKTRELVVVVDNWLSDTAELATLVLPCNTLLEADDVLGAYGHHYLGVARPVVPPPPGVKSDLEIIQGLAERVGLAEAVAGSARDWQEKMIAPRLRPHGITLEQLEAGPVRSPLSAQVLFAPKPGESTPSGFATASGRVNLIHDPALATEAAPPQPDGEYPLLLFSLSTEKSQSSQWPVPPSGPAVLTVHPDVAAAAGLGEGGLAQLESRIASLVVRVHLDSRQRRDVALIPKGGHLRQGRCANALVAAKLTDAGEGGALYDEPVRLRPLTPQAAAGTPAPAH